MGIFKRKKIAARASKLDDGTIGTALAPEDQFEIMIKPKKTKNISDFRSDTNAYYAGGGADGVGSSTTDSFDNINRHKHDGNSTVSSLTDVENQAGFFSFGGKSGGWCCCSDTTTSTTTTTQRSTENTLIDPYHQSSGNRYTMAEHRRPQRFARSGTIEKDSVYSGTTARRGLFGRRFSRGGPRSIRATSIRGNPSNMSNISLFDALDDEEEGRRGWMKPFHLRRKNTSKRSILTKNTSKRSILSKQSRQMVM